MNLLEVTPIYQRLNDFVKVTKYKTNYDYEIKVSTIGEDTHITAYIPTDPFLYAPKITFISKEGGTFTVDTSCVHPLDIKECTELISKAATIYEYIYNYYEYLVDKNLEKIDDLEY